MALPTNDDVMWYVGTRKDSGAHWILNENYMEDYQDEFERIREFDTAEEAKKAYDARKAADAALVPAKKGKEKLRVSKIRGDIRKGSLEDEALREKIKAEIKAEMAAESAPVEEAPAPKRKTSTRPTKAKLGD